MEALDCLTKFVEMGADGNRDGYMGGGGGAGGGGVVAMEAQVEREDLCLWSKLNEVSWRYCWKWRKCRNCLRHSNWYRYKLGPGGGGGGGGGSGVMALLLGVEECRRAS